MPKQRPKVKRRIPRAVQAAAAQAKDDVATRLFALTRAVDALIELAGQDAVRQASARMAAGRSLKALGNYVAQGKLVETRVVTPPATCAVEFSESNAEGAVLTPSIVAELVSIEPEMAALFAGKAAGDSFEARGVTVRVLRAWDVVAPAEAVSP
jgi:hypothetical protein